jgi:cell division protein FtsQ
MKSAPIQRPPLKHATPPLRMQPRQFPAAVERPRALRLLATCSTVVLLAFCSYGLFLAVHKLYAQKIEHVQIDGLLHYVSEDEIKATVGTDVATNLLTADLLSIKAKLEALPWIRKAEVHRQWPNAVRIEVEEEVAIARWGASQLLNQLGQVFEPADTVEQQVLPLLEGPAGSEQLVMEQYQAFNQVLRPLGVRIRDLTLKVNGGYELVLTNSVVVRLGKEALLERLRRLVVFLESETGQDLENVEAIDLRYRNGLALSHKQSVSKSGQQRSMQESVVSR